MSLRPSELVQMSRARSIRPMSIVDASTPRDVEHGQKRVAVGEVAVQRRSRQRLGKGLDAHGVDAAFSQHAALPRPMFARCATRPIL